MGALRAAELHPLGMEGYGWVFESYRSGLLEADDEVAMVHGDPEDGYPVFVDALVNIRQTVAVAVESGAMTRSVATQLIETARGTPFTMRTWDHLLGAVGAPDCRKLARQLRSMRVDIKHADAVLALKKIARGPQDYAVQSGVRPTIWSKRWQRRWAPPVPVAVPGATGGKSVVDVLDVDVLSLLCVCATDRWVYLPALEQVAAWYWTLMHPEDLGSVRERAAKAIAELEPKVTYGTYQRALEFVAHRHALATGVVDETGFPKSVSEHWLTAGEYEALGDDQIAVAARITTRTLLFTRSPPAVQHFLELLRDDPRLPEWRNAVACCIGQA
ncbi:hypothetical protein LAUMK35_05097 [Mycobacterium pseudokansasii]|nr:hypothetical protein LAUMK35_05097 [Mycobacterium pseudokansasii]VBA33555.1 hypothetical protein LAUMK21_05056 [Mycobacterium pseudokansasii]